MSVRESVHCCKSRKEKKETQLGNIKVNETTGKEQSLLRVLFSAHKCYHNQDECHQGTSARHRRTRANTVVVSAKSHA